MTESALQVVEGDKLNGVVVLWLSKPPVNALDHGTRTRLLKSLMEAEQNADVSAVVIAGRNDTFCGGADLEEFARGTAMDPPSLHGHVIPFIEAMSKPVVAAIDGVALGGGLELALGCHARVATASAKLGLPESNFGLIPGAGGTVRLPRAVGSKVAAKMITCADIVIADMMAETAMLDRVVEKDVVAAAVSLAKDMANAGEPFPLLRHLPVAALSDAEVEDVTKAARRRPSKIATTSAIQAVQRAATLPVDDAMIAEYRAFAGLLAGDESAALRHLFLAERAGARVEGLIKNIRALDVRKVGIIGAGFMGAGIAKVCAEAGLDVMIFDLNAEAAARAAEGGARVAEALEAFADCDLIIEAAVEKLEVKQAIFEQLDQSCGPNTILASNTSSIEIEHLAGVTSRPEQVIGIHFFGPVHAMRLVEVVRSADTDSQTIVTAMRFAKRLKKLPICVRSCPGFLGNRLFDRYLDQALSLVAEGCDPMQIDQALEGFGMRAGPFKTMDIIGNDVLLLARGAGTAPGWEIVKALTEVGRAGMKTGKGWYEYSSGRGHPDEAIQPFLPVKRLTDKTNRQIANRCLLALVAEAGRALDEGIAQRPSDIDVAFVAGYGFPAGTGGPMFWAETRGWPLTMIEMQRMKNATGDPFWEPARSVVEAAAQAVRSE